MAALDKAKVEARFGHLFGKVEGAFTCVLGHLGDKLGLYATLAASGPSTSASLAEATGLHERWVREWLHQQTAAGITSHRDGKFFLDDEAAEIYGTEDSSVFGAGAFDWSRGWSRRRTAWRRAFAPASGSRTTPTGRSLRGASSG